MGLRSMARFKSERLVARALIVTDELNDQTAGRCASRALLEAMRELGSTAVMAKAFSTLPVPESSPVEAYERLVRDEVEQIPLAEMAGRTVATGVVPYPPGIPLLMPGEVAGSADGPVLGYLRALETFDRRFSVFKSGPTSLGVTS